MRMKWNNACKPHCFIVYDKAPIVAANNGDVGGSNSNSINEDCDDVIDDH